MSAAPARRPGVLKRYFKAFIRWVRRTPGRMETPTVMQMEASECGAAALGSILAYYDCWEPLERLRMACGVSRDGSRLDNLMVAAQSYGMDVRRAINVPIEILRTMDHPVIL